MAFSLARPSVPFAGTESLFAMSLHKGDNARPWQLRSRTISRSTCARCLQTISNKREYKPRGFYLHNAPVGTLSVTGEFTASICNRCWNVAWNDIDMDLTCAEEQATFDYRFPGETLMYEGSTPIAERSRDVSDFFHQLIQRNLQEGHLSVEIPHQFGPSSAPLFGSRCACCLEPKESYPIADEGSCRYFTLENEKVGDAKVSGRLGAWICIDCWNRMEFLTGYAYTRMMFLANQGTLHINPWTGLLS